MNLLNEVALLKIVVECESILAFCSECEISAQRFYRIDIWEEKGIILVKLLIVEETISCFKRIF